jgi:hypothetical protein
LHGEQNEGEEEEREVRKNTMNLTFFVHILQAYRLNCGTSSSYQHKNAVSFVFVIK